jgi:hypothetical protein
MQGNHPKLGNHLPICIHFYPNHIDRKVDHRKLWELARLTIAILDRDYLCECWDGEKPARPSGSVDHRKFWTSANWKQLTMQIPDHQTTHERWTQADIRHSDTLTMWHSDEKT